MQKVCNFQSGWAFRPECDSAVTSQIVDFHTFHLSTCPFVIFSPAQNPLARKSLGDSLQFPAQMDTPLHDLCDTSDLLRCYELCIAYAFNVCVERLRGGAGRLVSSESGRCLSRAARGKDPQLSRGKDLPGAPRRCSARGGLGPPQAAPAPLQNIAVLGGPKVDRRRFCQGRAVALGA